MSGSQTVASRPITRSRWIRTSQTTETEELPIGEDDHSEFLSVAAVSTVGTPRCSSPTQGGSIGHFRTSNAVVRPPPSSPTMIAAATRARRS